MWEMLKAQKVIWRDDDPLSANHFWALEEWVEDGLAVGWQAFDGGGLITAAGESAINEVPLVSEPNPDGQDSVELIIGPFRAVTASGRVLFNRTRRKVNLSLAGWRDNAEWNLVHVFHPEPGSAQPKEMPPGTKGLPACYWPDLAVTTDPAKSPHTFAIGRIKREAERWKTDDSFIPGCMFVGSCSRFQHKCENAVQGMSKSVDSLSKALPKMIENECQDRTAQSRKRTVLTQLILSRFHATRFAGTLDRHATRQFIDAARLFLTGVRRDTSELIPNLLNSVNWRNNGELAAPTESDLAPLSEALNQQASAFQALVRQLADVPDLAPTEIGHTIQIRDSTLPTFWILEIKLNDSIGELMGDGSLVIGLSFAEIIASPNWWVKAHPTEVSFEQIPDAFRFVLEQVKPMNGGPPYQFTFSDRGKILKSKDLTSKRLTVFVRAKPCQPTYIERKELVV
ncbi:hypothetical protein Cflav_PD5622 [Pedosphaera parvula Ellin514]|uniref:Uncharacterized protein n=2 Tax=Pedosphaera TaxID=1032526 RepID=B9XAF2_PEDPL|nr:hypothetical protein Cflav_PD5622 [Pedosphaera parvula Ellin514]